MTPFVSIIIPNFNYAHFLPHTLDSVKKQSFKDWECIVVDDGSVDNSKSIVEKYTQHDERFRYHYQKNQGLSAARNTGLRRSKGKYIQFLDADDLISSNKLAAQVLFLENNSDYDMIISGAQYFNNEHSWDFNIELPIGKLENPFSLFLNDNRVPVSAPLLRATNVESVGYFDEQLRSLEDWQYWLRFFATSRFVYFGGETMGLTLIREHANSMKRDTWRMDLHQFRIRKDLHLISSNKGNLRINDALLLSVRKTLAYALCDEKLNYLQKKERILQMQKIHFSYRLCILRICVFLFKKTSKKIIWILFERSYFEKNIFFKK